MRSVLVCGAAAGALAACVQLAALSAATTLSSPLLATAIASRGDDYQSRQRMAELEQKQDWPGLLQFAKDRLRQEPDRSDWWVVAGYALLRSHRYPEAIASLTHATERSPEDIDGWDLLGEAQRLSGRPDLAARTLEQATSIRRLSHVSFFLLGEAYRDATRYQRAVPAYREAIRLEPDYSPAWFGLGTVYLRTGDGPELEKVVERLQKLNPPLADELRRLRAGNS